MARIGSKGSQLMTASCRRSFSFLLLLTWHTQRPVKIGRVQRSSQVDSPSLWWQLGCLRMFLAVQVKMEMGHPRR